jgi:hypothetical protein
MLVGGLYREQLRLSELRHERMKQQNVDLKAQLQELERQVGVVL